MWNWADSVGPKFRILRSILPVELLSARNPGDFAPIDKIVRVCCALVNMCPSIVVHIHEEMDESTEEVVHPYTFDSNSADTRSTTVSLYA